MKIIYDHQVFSLQRHGGITTVFTELVQHIHRRTQIRTDMLLGFPHAEQMLRSFTGGDSRVIQFANSPFRSTKLTYLLNEMATAIVAPILGKYDIYHSTLYTFSPFVRAYRKVATHHDCIHEQFPELFPRAGQVMNYKAKQFSQADVVICVSESSRNDLHSFYDIPPEKTVVIHNGITRLPESETADQQTRATLPHDYILYVGSRAEYKNFGGLLRAYSSSKLAMKHILVVVGGGDVTLVEKDYIRQLGIDGKIIWIPYAEPERLAAIYRLARLLVYPSRYEGFGMPPLEAAVFGCVSLTANLPIAHEVYQGGTFLFELEDSASLIQMLEMALTDESAREACLTRAREVLQRYTWEKCAARTLDIYRRLLES
jgi:glycosyltransferase involved in cell wall biosynthesis